MLHARIIVLALVAIAITAAIAVDVGSVGKAGAQSPIPEVEIGGDGELVVTRAFNGGHVIKCSYHLSVDNLLADDDTGRLYWQLLYSDRVRHIRADSDYLTDQGRIEIGPFRPSVIRRGTDAYDNPMPPRGDDHIWFWWLHRPDDRLDRPYRWSNFVGPYRNELHAELLKCAEMPPEATPTPQATATPEVVATATPSPTATTAPPVVVPMPATPTPTATPRSARGGADPTATPTASPTPSPTATPVSSPEDPQVDDSDIVAAILALIEVLKAWIEMQQ